MLREREHGNIEHLLVMPLRPFELMFAKIWANGLVVIVAAMLSLFLVVKGAIGVPIAGSIPLFAAGLAIYLFSVTALGIMLATHRPLDAAVRAARVPGVHRHEPAVRRANAAREHAGLPAEGDAVRPVDPLRQLLAGGAVPQRHAWRWSGHRCLSRCW